MVSRKLLAFLIPLIAVGFLLLLNKTDKDNKREAPESIEQADTTVFESRLKDQDTSALEKLSEKLTTLRTETLLSGSTENARSVQSGDLITVNYRGWLAETGEIFDESFRRGDDGFTFTNGQGVILGWSEGTIGMTEGEVRRLYIPSGLGYGESGSASIPANADLIFDVELIRFEN